MANEAIIAVDLGAESGRVVLGSLRDGKLISQEVHRFTHRPVPMPAGLCWDITGLWKSVLEGLGLAVTAARENGLAPKSIGVDTWGVDWTLVSSTQTMLGLPRCYRDPAFPDAMRKAVELVPANDIYDATGIQLMVFNTLFQLVEAAGADPFRFEQSHLLFMPDLFHWMLSGKRSIERTIASTSQMLDARTGDWATGLLDRLSLPKGMLRRPIDPGTEIGSILPAIAAAIGGSTDIKVIAPPSHDTAAAVAAVPADANTSWAYLSSGTWSLLGAELAEPCINEETAKANFTNELGVNGTVRFLKNIAGLWLVQECRRNLAARGESFDYPQLVEMAKTCQPFRTLVAVDHPGLVSPVSMIDFIVEYAKKTGQPAPGTPGEFVRCCLESLALEYRRVLRKTESLLGKKFDVLHIVGGGSRNMMLSEMTADAIGIPVCVGPAEATAMGNLLTQAMGLGLVKDLSALRAIVRETEAPVVLRPSGTVDWEKVSARYEALPLN